MVEQPFWSKIHPMWSDSHFDLSPEAPFFIGEFFIARRSVAALLEAVEKPTERMIEEGCDSRLRLRQHCVDYPPDIQDGGGEPMARITAEYRLPLERK